MDRTWVLKIDKILSYKRSVREGNASSGTTLLLSRGILSFYENKPHTRRLLDDFSNSKLLSRVG